MSELQMNLSNSVSEAAGSFKPDEPICAASFTRAVLAVFNHSKQYGRGKFVDMRVEDTPVEQTAQEWLNQVELLFDPLKIQELSKSKESAVLHGRLLIIGLSLLEPELRRQLDEVDLLDILMEELSKEESYSLPEILTEKGSRLFRATEEIDQGVPEDNDSVPNWSDDPVQKPADDLLGREAFARFLARRIIVIPPKSGSYAIHLYGPWGAGKSSLLNFLSSELSYKHLFLFNIDSRFGDEPNNRQLSPELRRRFKQHGELLSEDARMLPPKSRRSFKQPGEHLSEEAFLRLPQTEWTREITDGPECYLLQKRTQEQGRSIDVYTKQRRWLIVDFNAWRNQHIDPPWWSLLDAVYQSTKGNLSRRNRIREWFWRLTSGRVLHIFSAVVLMWVLVLSFSWVQQNFIEPQIIDGKPVYEILGKIATLVKDLGEVIAFVGTIWSGILVVNRSLLLGSAGAAATYKQRIQDPMNEIKKRFEKLIERLAPQRVAVFIDDLDRCQSEYVVELLEGIQTLFREAPVVYVVASDRQWLNACYEDVYQKLEPHVKEAGKPLGALFLEKAFRFSTPMPSLPKELKEEYWRYLLQIKASKQNVELDEERRKAKANAKALVEDAPTEAEVRKLTVDDKGRSFIAQRAVIEEAVVRLSAPEIMERLEHTLKPYSELLEPNPRAMKRLVNVYSAYRALVLLSQRDVDLHQLVLWTILSSRWPQLADYLAENPEKVLKIGQADIGDVDEDVKKLFTREEIARVIQGGSKGIALESDTLRQCAGMRE